jgi:ribonucleotide monophosphatase NagD (HAD superfamily)
MEKLSDNFDTIEEAVKYLFENQDQAFQNDSGFLADSPELVEDMLRAGQDIHTTQGERYWFRW